MDFVGAYEQASAARDIDALMDTLGPEPELVSPLSGRMVFRGRADLRVLLGAVYGSMDDLRWGQEMRGADRVAVIGECLIGPLRMSDAMVFDLYDDGTIHRIRPHLRPWLAVTAFAVRLGLALARHPGVMVRGLRG